MSQERRREFLAGDLTLDVKALQILSEGRDCKTFDPDAAARVVDGGGRVPLR
jgi:hypothetical protein